VAFLFLQGGIMSDGAVAGVAQSADMLGQILQYANQKSTDQAEKLMKVAVEMAVKAGQEQGKGQALDMFA
jgi:hypothetical protein